MADARDGTSERRRSDPGRQERPVVDTTTAVTIERERLADGRSITYYSAGAPR